MNKIICDICGSTYPETASCCPICGSSREFGVENPDYIPAKMPEYVPESKKKQGLFSSGAKKAQDYLYEIDEPEFDTMNDVLPEVVSNEDASCAPQKRSNYFVVVLLTSIIGICLLICGFLFFRYFLPHSLRVELPQKTEEIIAEESFEEESTDPTIPCKSIVLTTGVPKIDRIGQYWLLHVLVMPENTTDQLTFTSSDENVVTVTQEGRLCAVGEGKATIVISCGSEQILCQITVDLPDETSEEVSETAETSQSPEMNDDVSATEDKVILKLKQTDISFTKKGVTFQLELDCDIDPSLISWMTLDPDVAICHDGVITVLGNGTTRIVAQYEDQQVYCIVRCNFK